MRIIGHKVFQLFLLSLCFLPISSAKAMDAGNIEPHDPFKEPTGEPGRMVVLGHTSQPIGHFNYCILNPDDCSYNKASPLPRKLTRKLWSELIEVNREANQLIAPRTDLEQYSKEEFWTLPEKYGDCEDYVLLKRQMLVKLGWPVSSLLVTVVRQPNGEGHAVLTVRTQQSDFILDNLNSGVLPWNKTSYLYLKRQSTMHSGIWTDIRDSRDIVGSIKVK